MTTFYSVSNGNLVQAADVNQYYTFLQSMLTYRCRVYLNFQQNFPIGSPPPNVSYTRVLVNTVNTGLDPAQMFDAFNNGIRIPAAGIWRITARVGTATTQTMLAIIQNTPAGGGGTIALSSGTVGLPAPSAVGTATLITDIALLGVGDLVTMAMWTPTATTVGPDIFTYLAAEFLGPTS